jgi:hypothetical protein
MQLVILENAHYIFSSRSQYTPHQAEMFADYSHGTRTATGVEFFPSMGTAI